MPLPALVLVVASLTGWLAGCEADVPEDRRPLVAVSVPPQAYVVERLADARVRIEIMVPPGASPVTHEPTMRQLRALEEARLYVAVGHPAFPFESAWLEPLLDSALDVRVIEMADADATTGDDPHVWVTPDQIDRLATRLAEELTMLLPDAKLEIEAALERLLADVRDVDVELRARLAATPGRRFLVMHGAWGQLADAYGLEQIAIEQGHKAPDAHAVARLVDASRAAGARVIFVQPQFDDAAAELVAGEIGAEVVVLDPLAKDWVANTRHVADALAAGLY